VIRRIALVGVALVGVNCGVSDPEEEYIKVTGTVTQTDGSAMPNVRVSLYDTVCESWSKCEEVVIDRDTSDLFDGSYQVSGLVRCWRSSGANLRFTRADQTIWDHGISCSDRVVNICENELGIMERC
jgi:hypothetical protein